MKRQGGVSSAWQVGQLFAALMVLRFATGCGVVTSYVPTAGSPHAMLPRSTQDVDVFLSAKPDRPFEEVGMIEVQQGPGNNAGPNALVNELRRVAAQKGCDGLLVLGANDAVYGAASSTGTWGTRTLKGYRGTCIMFKDVKPHEPPRGAGGFAFDTDVATTEMACTHASLRWGARDGGGFTCSGLLANIGLNATSVLRFCADRLCSIELVAQPKGGSATEWRDEFRALRKSLERKYGHPASAEGSEPPDCAAEPERCSTPGRTSQVIRWTWLSGERIELALVVSQTKLGDVMRRSAEILISYAKDGPRPRPASRPSQEGL